MKKNQIDTAGAMPPANTNGGVTASPYIDKRQFARRWSGSLRWVDTILAQGLPHIKTSPRRVRIDVAESDEWMKAKFSTQRIGPA
jgi:hypothetical protein